MNRFLRHSVLFLFAASALIVGIGCSDRLPPLPPTVPISAKVTLDGKPLQKARIAFSPALPGPASNGQVVNGEVLDLWTNGQKQGVAIGEYTVTIYDQPMEANAVDLVPDKYGLLSEGISVTVTEAGPNEFLFELKRK
ncbi:hypothetical protein M4951_10525 [Blastopirellula sp. J2-11]|uniref:hypothetical protein n=1 Tax=Blastopirellula sp. J2-11 TaxID=2943192 RepID=UPI0021CAA704|nr:hypothetical protein [Blastopirellula sp. J2-11]UUO08730.1 hypothetical protein M4951_10525 [Blastopirellula sp. J2-11]